MRFRPVALATIALLAATGCASRPAATQPPVAPVASAVRCEVVFVEDASNDAIEVLVPSRSLLVHHQWSAEESSNFHAWSAPAKGSSAPPPAVLAWLIPSDTLATDDGSWEEEERGMDWVLPNGAGKTLQLFVQGTDRAPPSLLVDIAPIGAPESRVCVARQGRGI